MNPHPIFAPWTARKISAPAKINLTLDIGPPRPDGFHGIDSVVMPLAAPADTLEMAAFFGDDPQRLTLTCDDPALPTDDSNLAYRAARLFLEHFGGDTIDRFHLDIALYKLLPYQAGLGGGSSDAAAVLRVLSRMVLDADAADVPDVLAIAARVGSDVPLFLKGGLVRMQGRGELVTPLPSRLPPLWGVIVKPSVGVPTGPAYALLDALPDRAPGQATARLLALLQARANIEALGAALSNDFEAAILPAFPLVAHAHRTLTDAGVIRALLCGSGSAVFGLARDESHAHDLHYILHHELNARFPWVAVAQTESLS